jgi:DNA polymerase III subunit gamma/tau
MISLVLARKYRPRSFGEMVGQEHVVKALVNALTSQRLHHAYLFTGTRGIGKTTVSRILAKSLNCTGADGSGGITPLPCGVCQACTEIDADRYIDYTEMDAASTGGKDDIRDLIERAAYKPAVGRFKVFMIDEAHQLSKDAFNALLKTLEEPPDYLKFVLATTDPDKVLPTVLSRCLQFNLRPMAPETVRGRLEQVLEAEGVAAEPGALRLLSRAARGSMRDALSLTDQAIAFGAGSIVEDAVRQMLGTVGRGHVLALLDALAGGDGAAVVAGIDTLRTEGLSAEGTLEEMAELLQLMALIQAVPDVLDGDDPDADAIARLAGLLPADETQLLYSIALHGRAELALAPDEYSGLVMVLLRMLAFRPRGAVRSSASPSVVASAAAPQPVAGSARIPAPAAALVRPAVAASTAVAPVAAAAPERRPREAAVPLAPQRTASVPPWEEEIPFDDERMLQVAEPRPVPPIDALSSRAAAVPEKGAGVVWTATPLGDQWAVLVGRLNEAGMITALVRELALQSECLAIGAGESSIRVRVERDSLRNPAHAERLQAALTGLLEHPVALEIEAGVVGDTPARRDIAAREARQREAEALIHDDPLVRELTTRFKTARIVPGSIKPT